MSLRGLAGEYDDVFLPLLGAHQAHNAACALAAVEAFLGGAHAERGPLDVDLVRAAFAGVSSPGRLETVRSSPTVVLDAAHNPAGARATAEAVGESFGFNRLVGVFAAMADKDVRGMLEALEPVLAEVVVSRVDVRPGDAGRRAGGDRGRGVRRRPGRGDPPAGRRHRLGRGAGRGGGPLRRRRACWSPARSSRSPRRAPCWAGADGAGARLVRGICAAVLVFEGMVIFFATLVALDLSDVERQHAVVGGGRRRRACCLLLAGLLRWRWAFVAGSVLQVALVAAGFVVPGDVLPRPGVRRPVVLRAAPRAQGRADPGRPGRRQPGQ